MVRPIPISILMLTLIACQSSISGAGESAATREIPASAIDSLEVRLRTELREARSAVARRRLFKNTARAGQALIEQYPRAGNRFHILQIIFNCRKQLLALSATERNREDLFAVCEELTDAPDELAELRLEADLLLSERELSARNASQVERAEALEALVERYRETPAESKCLLMAALIVRKLNAPALERGILNTLDEYYSDDHEVIEFRRKHLQLNRLDLTFTGTFTRIDGTELRFPDDIMGRMSLMVFWSASKPGIEDYLKRFKEEYEPVSDMVDVFSFNLDDLPDSGEAFLRDHALDWTVMRLPGGRQNQAYRTYATGDPVAVFVNEYGLTVVRPEIVYGRTPIVEDMRLSEARYTAQLQSIFIGDPLVADPDGSVMKKATPRTRAVLESLRPFTPLPPFRYRLSRKEAIDNYTRIEALCAKALAHADPAEDAWILENRRIVALLGLWSLSLDPDTLQAATTLAETALASNRPAEANVVPRFCLAKQALRNPDADSAAILQQFLADNGGEAASGKALAAASILAIEARQRQQHEALRSRVLETCGTDPTWYSFAAFLRDRRVRYQLLQPNYSRRERHPRGHIVGHGDPGWTDDMPSIELQTLDGAPLRVPEAMAGRTALVLFVEPPADPKADFPARLDGRGNMRRDDSIRVLVDFAYELAESHTNKSLDVLVVFVSDDAGQARRLMQSNDWKGPAALVPGGLANPLIRQLGILSADRVANPIVLRRDGSIAWRSSGLAYKAEFGFPFAYKLAMKVHIELADVNHGLDALKRGDYETAAHAFAGSFPPALPQRFAWRSPRHHGRALALMGLNQLDAALEEIDSAALAHKLRHFRGRRSHPTEWRKDATSFTMKQPCTMLQMLWKTKVKLLQKSGKAEEAAELKKHIDAKATVDREDIYSRFQTELSALRDAMQ